jgi:hypothetical protein
LCFFPCAERVSSDHGYYTDECFEKYVDFLLDESKGGIPNDGHWRILVVDGYRSHTLVPSELQKFKDPDCCILMITMPLHSSHELQPLDRCTLLQTHKVLFLVPSSYLWNPANTYKKSKRLKLQL